MQSSDIKQFTHGMVKVRLWTTADLKGNTKKIAIGVSDIVNTTSLPEAVDIDKDLLFVSVSFFFI